MRLTVLRPSPGPEWMHCFVRANRFRRPSALSFSSTFGLRSKRVLTSHIIYVLSMRHLLQLCAQSRRNSGDRLMAHSVTWCALCFAVWHEGCYGSRFEEEDDGGEAEAKGERESGKDLAPPRRQATRQTNRQTDTQTSVPLPCYGVSH